MSRRFVAPGKVVVLGEYAVLDGAPALVAAVDIGVGCTWTPGPTLRTSSPSGDTRFVDAALAACDAPPGHYAFDEHNPPSTPSKPGLGGSGAAAVVATLAARSLRGEPSTPADLFHAAFHAHHAVQGSGSGVDVAASAWGGMLRFVIGATPTPAPPVELLVVWSGASAHTGPRVRAYRAWQPRDAFVQRSAELVEGFPSDPPGALREAGRLLHRMAEAAGIAYATPELTAIVALAEAHGGAAKPSGAGGGDCAVVLLPEHSRADFVRAAERAGYPVLATHLSPGARELPRP